MCGQSRMPSVDADPRTLYHREYYCIRPCCLSASCIHTRKYIYNKSTYIVVLMQKQLIVERKYSILKTAISLPFKVQYGLAQV